MLNQFEANWGLDRLSWSNWFNVTMKAYEYDGKQEEDAKKFQFLLI